MELPNTYFFEVHDSLCDDSTGMCGPLLPGWLGPTHRDENHLSNEGSFALWPRFRQLFAEAGLL